jgi:hypothetical protein
LRPSLPRSTSISIASLRALVRARVIAPEDADHDRARTSFYGGFGRHPAVVVRVADAGADHGPLAPST